MIELKKPRIIRPGEQLSLSKMMWKDFYLSGDHPEMAKFNIRKCNENIGLPHNAIVSPKFMPELNQILEIARSQDYRDLDIFRLDMGDYKIRVSQTFDFRGNYSICGRYIATEIPNFMDPQWGYDRNLIKVVLKWLNTPGYFLVLGKTGSGKTQLMFSALHYLMGKGSYVIRTAEDPVEYELETMTETCTCTQWEVREPKEWEFYLGHMVRTAPDIAGCGELRYGDTATTFFSVGSAGPSAFATAHGTSISTGMQRLYNIAKTGSMGEAASEPMADGFLGAIHIDLKVNDETNTFYPATTILDATIADDHSAIINNIRSRNFKALDPIIDRQLRMRNAKS